MKELMNAMAKRQINYCSCHDCGIPLETHLRDLSNCPIKVCAREVQSKESNCCIKCLLPHCNGAKECGHKYVLMIINIVCSKSIVNKIVEIKWPQFCNKDEKLLNSFPKGLEMTSSKCAHEMTSIYKKLLTDKDFRECFWGAVNATGIFRRKFFRDCLDYNQISADLLSLHSDLTYPCVEEI